ncbi:MAG: universal stress protein [Proteobacteria bacterium]|nr:universal stress protein [Pseudomonadota bacterium]
MIQIKNILVPTDCSEMSKDAVKYAVEFTKQLQAKLTLLTVTDPDSLNVLNDYGYFSPELHKKILAESEKREKKELERFWKSTTDIEVEAEMVVQAGDPFSEIIKYANSNAMDIIIMGTHGRTGLEHVFMGSVAEKVVRYSPFPVLTVKHKGYEFDIEKFT